MATDRLLRLSLLSPAHLGSAWGEAALDRPTQVDAWRGLPFLPASAVKGVLAGRWGDVPDEEGSSNAERERRYGSPDRGRERGRPSPIVVGDGRCLGFPAPTTHGPPCWVVPAEGLAWALDRTGLGDEVKDLLALLRTVEHPPGPTPKSLLVGGALPHLPGVRPLAPLENVPHQQAARLGRLVQAVCGGTVSEDQTVLIVEEATAGELWRAAADRRTSTALEADRKVVRSGFLRSVELIPEGSVFLSHVSLLGPEEPEPDKIQLGAWESLGFGWAELAWFDPETARRVEATDDAGGTPSPARASRTPGVALVMGQALEAVEALAEAGEEPTAAAGRAAVRSFGWRFRERGPQAVLAFELAKARPRDPQPSAEVRAHRWLLLALGVHQDAFAADPAELKAAARNAGECRPLIEWIESAPFETPLAPEEEWALLDRLGWLRRYAELLLPTAPEARKAAP